MLKYPTCSRISKPCLQVMKFIYDNIIYAELNTKI